MTIGAHRYESVAVVIPARAPAQWLGEAIQSVLAQTYPVVECVVVDDGSPGVEVARAVAAAGDDRVRYVRQEHAGVASARNLGVRLTKAALISFLDADDLWLAGKLRRQVDVLVGRTRADVVVTSYAVTDERRGPRGTVTVTGKTLRSWLLGNGAGMAFGSTALLRRQLFERLGGFEEALSVSADLDFALRAAAVSPIEILTEPLVVYRTHDGQMHSHYDDLARDANLVLGRHLAARRDRRRAEANLHCRMAWARARRRDLIGASWALLTLIENRPVSLVELPVRVAVDRLRMRWHQVPRDEDNTARRLTEERSRCSVHAS